MSDYEIDYDRTCPNCEGDRIHYRECINFHCVDGRHLLFDEDPLYYMPGETKICEDCRGTGVEMWCPNCGADLSDCDFPENED